MKTHLLIPTLFLAVAAPSQAAIIYLDLIGVAGAGLLPGNEPGTVTGGTGGELSWGIIYDDVTNILNLTNFGWGSSQGFTDLTSVANHSHIHGSTANANGNTMLGDFRDTAGVLVNLTRSSSAVTGGVFTNPIIDFDTQFGAAAETREAQLLSGRFYINLHTVNNGPGEARGFLVVVPEPSSALLGLGSAAMFFLRRRRTGI